MADTKSDGLLVDVQDHVGEQRTLPPPRRQKRIHAARMVAVLLAIVVMLSLGVNQLVQPGAGQRSPPAIGPIGWVQRVTAATTPVVDSQGAQWLPSDGFRGGTVTLRSTQVRGTGSPQLYRPVRTGVASYTTPVPGPGTYAIGLYLADDVGTKPGQRVFDVLSNDVVLASHLDVVARSGPADASDMLALAAVRGSTLTLRFTPSAGAPIVSAVAIAYMQAQLSSRLLWSDKFAGAKGAAPSAERWTAEKGGSGWGNDELEYYTDDLANAHLDGAGHLALTAIKEDYTGPDGVRRGFTSARLTTKNSVNLKYGMLTARLKLPAGKGLWPAFWAIGSSVGQIGWPKSGEIDVVEGVGTPGEAQAHVHGPEEPAAAYGPGAITEGTSSGFVDYSALWTPIGISMSADGREYYNIVPADLTPKQRWAFDQPFYLVLNLAVGGNVPGLPDRTTRFPAVLLVDYVRVCQ